MKKEEKKTVRGKKLIKANPGTSGNRYPAEQKLRFAKLHIEEKMSLEMLMDAFGVSKNSLQLWISMYRKQGEGAFGAVKPAEKPRKTRLAGIRETVLAVKRENPGYGKRRISDVLKRFFHLPGSPETVQRKLKAEGIIPAPVKKKPKKKAPYPCRFERSRPNQMWQSDIHIYQINRGDQVYFIGYLDDCSRYIVAMDVFTAQTADNVIAVYRKGRMEHGSPEEMLTDNGRQYTSWRGRTNFERELAKDRVRHIKSKPHHPMTLGKIERIWKTLDEEFLARVRFEGFDGLRRQLQYWIQHYNFMRPHQGIDGICPADRYFGMESEIRRVMKEAIAENVEQLALNGHPHEPFMMVGRVGDQTVTVEARRGKIKMLVDGKSQKEYIYDMKGDGSHGKDKEQEHSGDKQPARGDSEVAGGAEHMDGEEEAEGDMQGTWGTLGGIEEMGEPGIGRDDKSALIGAEGKGDTAVGEKDGADAGQESEEAAGGGQDETGEATGNGNEAEGSEPSCGGEKNGGVINGQEKKEPDRGSCKQDGTGISGLHGATDGEGSCPETRDQPENLLRVGKEDTGGIGKSCGEQAFGEARQYPGPGEGGFESPKQGITAEGDGDGDAAEGQGCAVGMEGDAAAGGAYQGS